MAGVNASGLGPAGNALTGGCYASTPASTHPHVHASRGRLQASVPCQGKMHGCVLLATHHGDLTRSLGIQRKLGLLLFFFFLIKPSHFLSFYCVLSYSPTRCSRPVHCFGIFLPDNTQTVEE